MTNLKKRVYFQPFKKETMRSRVADRVLNSGSNGGEFNLGLMATPGLPDFNSDNFEELMSSGGSKFGNFRRQTLLHYLDNLEDSPDLKVSANAQVLV